MKLPCPYCKENITYDLNLAGKTIKCSYCQKNILMTPLDKLPPEYQQEFLAEQEHLKKKQEAEERKRKAAEYRAEFKRKAAKEAAERKAFKTALHAKQKDTTQQTYLAYGTRIQTDRFRERIVQIWKRIVYIFDLDFQRYLTPHIIRIIWALLLALSVCGIGLMFLSRLPMASPRYIEVANPQRGAQYAKIEALKRMISEKEMERSLQEWQKKQKLQGQQKPQEPQEQKNFLNNEEVVQKQPDNLNKYAKMDLDQLKSELAKLDQEYPEHLKEIDFSGALWYALFFTTTVLSTIIALLICRVICEMFIVVFNIANCLVKVREILYQAKSPIAPPPAPQTIAITGDGKL
jgi:hypothetical protein